MDLTKSEIEKLQTFLRKQGCGCVVSGNIDMGTERAYHHFAAEKGIRYPDCNIFPSCRAELHPEALAALNEGTVDITSDDVLAPPEAPIAPEAPAADPVPEVADDTAEGDLEEDANAADEGTDSDESDEDEE